MDKIHLRSEVIYRNEKYHGYKDLGFHDTDADSVLLAQKAMVSMLVCLNDMWKIPIAYFLTSSLDEELLSHLVKNTVACGQHENCCSVSTFDGLGVNLTCIKFLGANLTFGPNFKPWFPHPCHE